MKHESRLSVEPGDRILVRDKSGVVERIGAEEFGAATLRDAIMWRKFRWHRGQRHFPGWYWSSTTGDFVGYESRLELSRLMILDHDPNVAWITSQPFLLEVERDGKVHRHVPDYGVLWRDGAIGIVDVKPARLREHPKVVESLGWSGAWIRACGWRFDVESEPDPMLLQNLRFLAGYRRLGQFREIDLDAVCGELESHLPFGALERRAASACGGPEVARALLLHLIWSSRLTFDMAQPLGRNVIIEVM